MQEPNLCYETNISFILMMTHQMVIVLICILQEKNKTKWGKSSKSCNQEHRARRQWAWTELLVCPAFKVHVPSTHHKVSVASWDGWWLSTGHCRHFLAQPSEGPSPGPAAGRSPQEQAYPCTQDASLVSLWDLNPQGRERATEDQLSPGAGAAFERKK